MKIQTRLASAAIIGTVALSAATAAAGTAVAQPITQAPVVAPQSPTDTIDPASLPPELRAQIAREIDNLNASTAPEGSEEWGFLAVAAARAIVAGARTAGPAVYNALASAVRSGYSSFNGWCVRNPFLCAIPGGLGTAALYDALKGIIN